jgi:hypothetical protein
MVPFDRAAGQVSVALVGGQDYPLVKPVETPPVEPVETQGSAPSSRR